MPYTVSSSVEAVEGAALLPHGWLSARCTFWSLIFFQVDTYVQKHCRL